MAKNEIMVGFISFNSIGGSSWRECASVEPFLPGREWNHPLVQFPVRLPRDKTVAIDYHQVTDTSIHSSEFRYSDVSSDRWLETPWGFFDYSLSHPSIRVHAWFISFGRFLLKGCQWTLLSSQRKCGHEGKLSARLYALGAHNPLSTHSLVFSRPPKIMEVENGWYILQLSPWK